MNIERGAVFSYPKKKRSLSSTPEEAGKRKNHSAAGPENGGEGEHPEFPSEKVCRGLDEALIGGKKNENVRKKVTTAEGGKRKERKK